MSTCAIIPFRNNLPAEYIEFRNSHGGAAFIWTALFDKYCARRKDDHWIIRGPNDRTLWDLATNTELPLFERAVHTATFDHAIVSAEHFLQYTKHLQEFVGAYPYPDRVCHLPAWYDAIEQLDDCQAIGFWQTSVTDDLWEEWDEETDEAVPYDLSKRSEHFEVYDWLTRPVRTGG